MTEDQFIQITRWQEETFPQATPLSAAYHLLEEVKELIRDIEVGNPEKRLEYADCFLLLFGAAAKDKMNYEDICNTIEEKMSINRKRNWGKPNDQGYVKHVS